MLTVMLAMSGTALSACNPGGATHEAGTSTKRLPPSYARLAEPPPIEFDRFDTVNLAEYATYRSYGVSAVQFTTNNGIRCRIQTMGNRMPGPFGISCWGEPPGMSEDINTANVSIWGHDIDDKNKFNNVDPARIVYSELGYTDPAILRDTVETSGIGSDKRPTDPSSYHLLAPGQKIVVSRRDENDPNPVAAICAVGGGGSLSCDMQSGGIRHGFFLSPADRNVY